MNRTHKVVERPGRFLGVKGYANQEAILFVGSEGECYAFLREQNKSRREAIQHSSSDVVRKILSTTIEVKRAWPQDCVTPTSAEE